MQRLLVTCSVVLVILWVAISATNAFRVEDYIVTPRKRTSTGDVIETPIPIQKRYTEYQDNAIAYCTGSCMYKARLLYGDCYDLCNWNGRAPSPWVRLFQGRSKMTKDLIPQKNWQSVLANRSGRQSLSRRLPVNEKTAAVLPPVANIVGGNGGKAQTSGIRAIMGRKKGNRKGCT